MNVFAACVQFIAAEGRGALVRLQRVEGSAPQDEGATMAVAPDGRFSGTIGGGALEWRMLAETRKLLAGGRRKRFMIDQLLGPDLGQCCGGRVSVAIEIYDSSDIGELNRRAQEAVATMTPLLLFGAGHVGRALVLALAPLPFIVRWLDGRPDAYPAHVPANVVCEQLVDVAATLGSAPDGAFALIMTHDHGLDLEIVHAALLRRTLGFVGLIGSATKRARFKTRLAGRGLGAEDIDRLVCPIGEARLESKAPAEIAAGIAVDLLLRRALAAKAAEPLKASPPAPPREVESSIR